MWSHGIRFRISSNAWLYRVCRNQAFDEMRKMKVSSENNGFVARQNFVESNESERLEQTELLQGVQSLLDALPAEQREAIEMWSHGIRFREIANVIGKSEGAIRVTVHRAIKSIRESKLVKSYLNDDGQDQPAANQNIAPAPR